MHQRIGDRLGFREKYGLHYSVFGHMGSHLYLVCAINQPIYQSLSIHLQPSPVIVEATSSPGCWSVVAAPPRPPAFPSRDLKLWHIL